MKSKHWLLSVCLLTAVISGLGLRAAWAHEGEEGHVHDPPPAAEGDISVAVIDIGQVFQNLREKEDADTRFEQMATVLQDQQTERHDEVALLASELDILEPGSEEWRAKQEEIQYAQVQLRVWQEFQVARLNAERARTVESLYLRMLAGVKAHAEATGIEVVLYYETIPNLGQAQSPQDIETRIKLRQVLYAADSVNITTNVIRRMNNEYLGG